MRRTAIVARTRGAGTRRVRRQSGLTLIEMLVTITLITVGVVGITGAIAAAERNATINQDVANIQAAMRILSDLVRSDLPAPAGLPYNRCAKPGTYNWQLPSKPSGITSWTITGVNESMSASRNGSPLSPHEALQNCGGGMSDWGVQEITLQVSSSARSLIRVVWKGCADDPRTCAGT
jgi:prepilin-type N-terminal cleavage/methylation domain-containing protein